MGERLYESRLAEELGISRAPIREALRRLAQDQLVVARPRRGMFVREFTAQDLIDLYNTRIALEQTAIRLVTRRQPDLSQLDLLVSQMADETGNLARLVETELAFHETLVNLSGNAYLQGIYSSLSAQIRLGIALDDAGYSDLGDLAREHKPVVDAIRSGNEQRAAKVLEEEILLTIEPVIRRLGGAKDGLLGRRPLKSRTSADPAGTQSTP
jgi:DNA-binding GntR family transcriptional regulator